MLTKDEYAKLHKFRIPRDISVRCIDNADHIKSFPHLSAVPFSNFGAFVCACLINKIEKRKNTFTGCRVCGRQHGEKA